MRRMFGFTSTRPRSSSVHLSSEINKPITPNLIRNGTRGSTDSEITSIKILHLIEKKKYHRAVELLRELPRAYLLSCLESFPFKALNRSIPYSFSIWETLLTKVHNNDEGYVREFPYAACDELVLKIAHLLAHLQRESVQHHDNNQLYQQCRRLLKKVYMHYHDIVKNLMKENERVSRAIYSMTLHIPLGLEPSSAISLQQSIHKEVVDSLSDFEESKERLEELTVENGHIHVEVTSGCNHNVTGNTPSSPSQISAHKMTQIQVQERLYSNQCVLGAVKPIRRTDNLPQLTEILNTRVSGDKEVLAIFSSLRKQIPKITEKEPIEAWLRKYQHSVECAITLLKEIEEELIIKSPNVSPTAERESQELHPAKAPSLTASPPPPSLVTQSTASLDHHNSSEDDNLFIKPIYKQRSKSEKLHLIRPNSAVNLTKVTVNLSQSVQSIDKKGCNELEESSSAQDIPLKVHSEQPMAGMKKESGGLRRSLRYSMRRLSSSTGSVSPKKKKMHRTSSNGRGVVLDEAKNDLLEAQEIIQSLRKRERELTDRLSEQAQQQLQDSDMFEDILMGASRPSLVIQRYQELYSQERVEAYDAISDTELVDDAIVPEFLLDIMKMAYSAAQCNLSSLHNKWKRSLECRPEDESSMAYKQLETAISTFIKKVAPSHEPHGIVNMVEWDLEKKYGSIPCFHLIMRLKSVCDYIHESAKLSWDLIVQTPPMVLNYKEVEFISELHTRFHTADRNADLIIMYQWPTLIQERSGTVLFRGVVVT